jgi:hypothetical protein
MFSTVVPVGGNAYNFTLQRYPGIVYVGDYFSVSHHGALSHIPFPGYAGQVVPDDCFIVRHWPIP